MQPLKSVFGVIGTLAPVVYCGSLLCYFLDLGGSVEEVESIGLGPTVLGLAVVGLLFYIPLIIKIVRICAGWRSPGAGGTQTPDGGIDADAMLARYMARRSAEDAPSAAVTPPAAKSRGPAPRPSFGRKIR